MQRTTVMLPRELKTRAVLHSRRLGISLGELIRSSLRAASKEGVGAGDTDSMYGDLAVYRGSAPKDLSAAHDAYLYGDER